MRRIVVATYNVHSCVGCDGKRDPARVLEVLRAMDADVIALQELAWDPAHALHLLDDFAQRLGYSAFAGPTLLRPNGHYGNALLTRLPVTRSNSVDLSVPGREPRGALEVVVQTPSGRVLRMIATHLGLWPGERRQQMLKILSLLSSEQGPAVLLGDLNEWFLWGRHLRWLHSHFGRTPGPRSFPSRWPVFSLDRVWVEPVSLLERVEAWRAAPARVASDHLPVRAVLRDDPL